jgi:hypothetical protein
MFSTPFFDGKPREYIFGFFLLTTFISTTNQLDNFYASGWFFLSLVVFVSTHSVLIRPTEKIKSIVVIVIPLIYAVCFKFDLDQLGIYLLLFYWMTCEVVSEKSVSPKIRALINITFAIWSSFLILSLLNLINLGYTHLNTYKCVIYFPHRNLLLEYGILFTYIFTQGNSFNPNQKLLIQFLYLVVLIIFQAKAAILSAVLLLVLNHTYFRIPVIVCGLTLFGYNIPSLYKYAFHKWDYFNELHTKNIVRKNLDLVYVFRYSGSAVDRINTYDWTIQNLNFFGHGIGSWKHQSMGKIEVKEGPNILHRRTHNEFLLILYEYGIITGVLILVFLFIKLKRNNLLFLLPIIIFSFPFERPDFISLLFFSNLLLPNDPNV